MSRVTLGLGLIVGWVMLWGSASPGTVLGGIAVVLVLFSTFPSSRPKLPSVRLDLVALVRLVGYFTSELVVSNLRLSVELVRPTSRLRGEVVDVEMHTTSPSVITAVSNLAAMSPGTMVVGTSQHPPVLRIHVLVFGGREGTEESVESIRTLERLSLEAFGTEADRSAYQASIGGAP